MIGSRAPVRKVGVFRACRTSTSAGPRAFTLIELLVVVTIIVMLATILAPSLQSVIRLGKDVKCKTNLQRLGESFVARVDAQDIPNAWSWISVAKDAGAIEVTACPLGGFEEGGANGTVQVGGAVASISPPPSVVFNDFESSSTIHMFTEQTSYPLPSNVTVDITKPGLYGGSGGSGYSISSTVLPAGTAVDCHFVFFDPVGSQNSTVSGSITVGAKILGIICTKSSLDNSDSILGMPGTRYDTGRNARQFEKNAEVVTLSEDMRTVTINRWHSTYPGENMRIVTEPGSGGSGSYGMNVEANPRRKIGQILLIDYESSVVYPGNASHDTILENMLDDGRFHLDRHLNAFVVGGTVEKFTFGELQARHEDLRAGRRNPNWYGIAHGPDH